jgi:hypothetical protein
MNAVLMTSAVTVTIQDGDGLIFWDGFETGDLSAWTSASPGQRFDDPAEAVPWTETEVVR